jgi:hypothetical protein
MDGLNKSIIHVGVSHAGCQGQGSRGLFDVLRHELGVFVVRNNGRLEYFPSARWVGLLVVLSFNLPSLGIFERSEVMVWFEPLSRN